jgi:hypothetical protein
MARSGFLTHQVQTSEHIDVDAGVKAESVATDTSDGFVLAEAPSAADQLGSEFRQWPYALSTGP